LRSSHGQPRLAAAAATIRNGTVGMIGRNTPTTARIKKTIAISFQRSEVNAGLATRRARARAVYALCRRRTEAPAGASVARR
jgi:hypothetical protein